MSDSGDLMNYCAHHGYYSELLNCPKCIAEGFEKHVGTTGGYSFCFSPPVVGTWNIGGGVSFHVTKRPNKWVQFWHRVILGWVWEDKAE